MKATYREKTIDLAAFLALAFVILTTIYCYWVALFFAPINFDAGYYLPISTQLAHGAVPFIEVPMRYTPLGIYSFAFLEWWLERSPDFSQYQLLLLFFQLCNVVLLFQVSKAIRASFVVRLFFCVSALLLQYRWMPLFIELEPIYLCFTLLAILLVMKMPTSIPSCFIAGVLCSLSFLSKQYGLNSVLPVVFLIFASSQSWTRKLKLVTIAMLGVCLPVVVGVGLLFAYGATSQTLLFQVSGHGYLTQVHGILSTPSILISNYPILILVPWAMLYGIDSLKIRFFVLFWLLASISPFLLKAYAHYFVPVLLGVSLLNMQLTSLFIEELRKHKSQVSLRKVLAGIGCAVVVILVLSEVWYSLGYANWMRLHNPRARQRLNVTKMIEYFPHGSTVLCIADQSIFYLGGYEPPRGPFGGFVGDVSHGHFTYLLRHTSKVIEDRLLDRKYYMDRPYLRRSVRRRIIKHAGFKPIATVDSRYTLWKKS